VMVVFGSGSSPRRERVVLVRRESGQLAAREVHVPELYAALRGDVAGQRLQDPLFEPEPGRRRRVLAAVDVGRLGAPCVALHFTRLLFLHGAALRRHGPDVGDDGVDLPPSENAVVDRRCPASGVALYSVAEGDQEDWVLRVYALPEPAAPAAPTGEAAPRRRRRRH